MASELSNGLIVVTVGLPGAGKTTLCKALVEGISKDASIICRYVCYDAILNDRDSWNHVRKIDIIEFIFREGFFRNLVF